MFSHSPRGSRIELGVKPLARIRTMPRLSAFKAPRLARDHRIVNIFFSTLSSSSHLVLIYFSTDPLYLFRKNGTGFFSLEKKKKEMWQIDLRERVGSEGVKYKQKNGKGEGKGFCSHFLFIIHMLICHW